MFGGGMRATGGHWSVVTILIAINVAIFFFLGKNQEFFLSCAMQTDAVLHGQVWRLLTSQYLHASLMHLLFNMFGLYVFGPMLERTWGSRKFFTIYTIAGVCGNLFLAMMAIAGWIRSDAFAIGASGCVLGLLGGCAALFPRMEIYIWGILPVQMRTLAIVLAAGYVLKIAQQGNNYGGDACHLAGLAFGVWYARIGDLWWTTKGSRMFAGAGRGKRQVRQGAGAWQRKMQSRKADAALIDELLAKVYDGGLHSLSSSERKALTQATERQQREEQGASRVDRL